MDITMRKAACADLDALADLYRAVSQEVSGTDNDPIWEVGVYPTMEELARFIDEGAFYIAEVEGRMAGALVATHGSEDGYEDVAWRSDIPLEDSVIIHLFGMHPDFKGQGLARPIMEWVAYDLRATGERVLRLDVIAENVGAQRVYERLGFAQCGGAWLEYPDYQGEFVFFEKEL